MIVGKRFQEPEVSGIQVIDGEFQINPIHQPHGQFFQGAADPGIHLVG